MQIMIWCNEHKMPVEGDLKVVKIDGTEYSFAVDTREMWCQTWDGSEPGKHDACHETWQTSVTIDSH
jgi:hypothetical protein